MKYARLKNGQIYVVWSDNVSDRTYSLMPQNYDVTVDTCIEVSYDNVTIIDNLSMFN